MKKVIFMFLIVISIFIFGCDMFGKDCAHKLKWSFSQEETALTRYKKCEYCNEIMEEENKNITDCIIYKLSSDNTYGDFYIIQGIENKELEEIVIPLEREGIPVKYINSSAFSNCANLKSVVIPDSIEYIGSGAFRFCTKLEEVSIPSSVLQISNGCFIGCENLKNIEVTTSLSGNIGDLFGVFHQRINVYYQGTLDDLFRSGLYFDAVDTLYLLNENNEYYEVGEVIELEIPNTVTEICTDFSTFKNLERVTFEEGSKITKIPYQTFSGCKNLKDIEIPEGVTLIDMEAFSGCKSLESITLPNSLIGIGINAFWGCSNLADVKIADNVKDFQIASSAFKGCTSLESITIPEGATYIGSKIFEGCTNLKNIIIKSEIANIEEDAFQGCENLNYNTFDNAIYLGNSDNPYLALIKCSDKNISSCEISSKTKVIACNAFSDCTNLTSLIIPESVTTIGSFAFGRCTSLKSITIPKGVKSIADSTFSSCANLESVIISEGVTTIERGAFSGCVNLKSVLIPNSVTLISSQVFQNCTSLESIIIPKSVTYIGRNAFDSCDELTIYCAVKEKPERWVESWNNSNCPVVWGYEGK